MSKSVCFTLCILSFVSGLVLLPIFRYLFLFVILHLSPVPHQRFEAAHALTSTKMGRAHLRRTIQSGSSSLAAATALAETQKPWDIYSMLGDLRTSGSEEEYRIILSALDYVEYHRNIMHALEYEYTHQTNEDLRNKIKRIKQDFVSLNGGNP